MSNFWTLAAVVFGMLVITGLLNQLIPSVPWGIALAIGWLIFFVWWTRWRKKRE